MKPVLALLFATAGPHGSAAIHAGRDILKQRAEARAHVSGSRQPGATAVRVHNGEGSRTYDPSHPLRVISWNVQFLAGTGSHFFYDGGRAVSASAPRRGTVRANLEKVAEAILREDPDIVMLQEVDRRCLRTGFVDQHAELLRALGGKYRSHTSAWYWRVPWVPHPTHEHVGAMNMHLSVFSKYELASAQRIPLPLLKESRLRRIFNLRRAVLATDVVCSNGERISVLNTHLSAFSNADGTLASQVAVLTGMIAQINEQSAIIKKNASAAHTGHTAAAISGSAQPAALSQGASLLRCIRSWLRRGASPPHREPLKPLKYVGWVLAGDLNSLPPGVPPSRHLHASEAALYGEAETPIATLYNSKLGTPVLPPLQLADPATAAKWFSYKPFEASSADRTIDHAFVGGQFAVASAKVVPVPGWPSDHAPIVMDLRRR